MSLHRILSIVMIAIAAPAIGMSISLITLTTYLHKTIATLQSDAHTIRLVEEMEVDLLTHAHSKDGVLRANTASNLRRSLAELQSFVTDGAELSSLVDAQREVGIYLDKTSSFPPKEDPEPYLAAAFSALEALVDDNLAQTERTLREAERWDVLGDWIGFGATSVLLLATAALLIWLRFYAFRSVLQLRHAMKKFATGFHHYRAPETGPEELRSIAKQFNEMADAL